VISRSGTWQSSQTQWLRLQGDGNDEISRPVNCPSPMQVHRRISELADGRYRTNGAKCPFSIYRFQRLCMLRETCDGNNRLSQLGRETASTIHRDLAGLERAGTCAFSNVALLPRFASCRSGYPPNRGQLLRTGADQRRHRLRRMAQSPARICLVDCAIRPAEESKRLPQAAAEF